MQCAVPSVSIIGTRGYPSYYGGFETAVRKLAPYLRDHGWDVTVYGRKGALTLDDPDLDSGVRTVTTRGFESRSLSTLSYGLTSAFHAMRKRPDVVLVMNVANGYFLPLLRSRQIPIVLNVDGMEWERAKWGRLAKRVFKGGANMTARFADFLVVDAEEIGRRWESEFGRGGRYIPYGADFLEDLPIEEGLESGTYVLYVARFVPENSFSEFLAAAETMSTRHPVVIVGSSGYGGALEDELKASVGRNPNIRWLGHIRDQRRLLALWQHAGAYFHGHSVGGTNPALVQALACGSPVVARDTPYNAEVLGPSAGILVAPTPGAISGALNELMADAALRARLTSAGRSRAAERFTWESVCESYEAALNEAIGGART